MLVKVLASGSNGNMTIIKLNNNKVIAIDCGINFNKLKLKLNEDNILIDKIDYMFITHHHQDHVSGLSSILKKFVVDNIYLSKTAFSELIEIFKEKNTNINIINLDNTLNTPDFNASFIELNHDADETCGIILFSEGKKLVYITDTAFLETKYYKAIENADIYIIEASYDDELMKYEPDIFLKNRIINNHLSNTSTFEILGKVVEKPCIFIAMHISLDRNSHYKIIEHYNNFKLKNIVKLYLSQRKEFTSLEGIII